MKAHRPLESQIEAPAPASVRIQAIETRYKGYRFRSRLEARWAVFFDHLKIEWEYEPDLAWHRYATHATRVARGRLEW